MTTGTSGASGSEFRPDIQGMRAIAVLLVLVFHVFPSALPGGYVGVDVVFVISGFLITGILLRSAQRDKRVGFLKFYERRARRLLPAASLALIIPGLLAFFLLPATRWEGTGWEIISSAFYVENFYLHFQSLDYLAADYDPSPFQHFWSLSIEEQFYIFWPLLIGGIAWVMARQGRSPTAFFALAFLAVFGVSLALSILETPRGGGAYFLSWARAWELALGGLVALARPYIRLPVIAASILRWLGILAILIAGFWYTTETAFPGYAALLPTLGSAILLATPHAGRLSDPGGILSLPPIRYIGDISYSLYLWHWPVVVFATVWTGRELGAVDGVTAIVLSVALAHMSKFHVEDRFRERPAGSGGMRSLWVCASFVVASLLVAASLIVPTLISRSQVARLSIDVGSYPGALILENPDLVLPDVPFIPPLPAVRRDNPEAYVLSCHVNAAALEPAPCRYGPEDARFVVAITGDSHAAHWIPALRVLAEQRDYAVYTFTKSGCEFIAAPTNLADGPYEECTIWNRNTLAALIELQPDLVVTSKAGNTWITGFTSSADNNERTVRGLADAWSALGEAGIPVLAIEQTPAFTFDIPDCVAANLDDPDQCARPLASISHAYDAQIDAARLVATASTANLNEVICGGTLCRPILGNVLVYRDPHHLTATFSRTLGPALAAHVIPIVEGRTVDIGPQAAPPVSLTRSADLVSFATAQTGFEPGDYPGAMARIDRALSEVGPQLIRPQLDRAHNDFPDIFRTGCHAGRSDVGTPGCSFGREDAEHVILLAGDNATVQWFPPLQDIAAYYDLRLIVRTRSRCPLIDAPIMDAGGSTDEQCLAWNEAMIAEIERLSPDLVVTSMDWELSVNGVNGRAEVVAATEAGLARVWTRIGEMGIPVLAIAATPNFNTVPADCLAANDRNMAVCSEPRRSVLPLVDPISSAAARVSNVESVSFNDLICMGQTCPPAMGNVLIYRNPQNLSVSYTRTLAPVLAPPVLSALGIEPVPAAFLATPD